jgi:hypothetical protein
MRLAPILLMMARTLAKNQYLVKGSVVRAHIAYLAKNNKLTSVLSRVGPATVACIHHPPLAGSWVAAGLLVDVVAALHQIAGDRAVLDMSNEFIQEQAVQSLIPMVQGVLRIFGTSPASLFNRFSELTRTSVRGVDYKYTVISERSGMMSTETHTDLTLPAAAFLPRIPAFELALKLCGKKGTVGLPERIGSTQARYLIQW